MVCRAGLRAQFSMTLAEMAGANVAFRLLRIRGQATLLPIGDDRSKFVRHDR
jgi:hypothetical protein